MDILSGSKLTLSQFKKSDITEEYISWLNNPDVVRYSNQRFVKHDKLSCNKYLKSFKNSDNLFFAIKTKDTEETIGTITVYVNSNHGTAEVGILIGKIDQWGQGYGQDAWNTTLDWLVNRDDIRKITAGTLSCNKSMIHIIEKSGMKIEGIRNFQEIVEEKVEDIYLFSYIKN